MFSPLKRKYVLKATVLFKSGVEKTYFGGDFATEQEAHRKRIQFKEMVQEAYVTQVGAQVTLDDAIINIPDTSSITIEVV